ncbi:MAG: sigma-54-dependent Fis family transcriptional regulator [Acidobacteria bacterium]|uniref:Sigma-54-dependent Fis family transcriptional regulator n=1 Tax=Candidatus Polarisedimenticola svalbardensis TaxID=2886004 RepID=A0A8J6Y443_9BACT|nr:sigma-54-dependent Fis family transcriptional regulator [Candidatus Polarisedimenticola svalbardensis]
MLDSIRRFATCALPVLVTGETGTGKEGAARMLHDLGPRRHGPFLALNCAALPETLLEAELFGTVRGAYTGAAVDRHGLFRSADGGTLLLDEIGDMPPQMQAKLLRVLQEGTVRPVGGDREIAADVRIVSASHRDLAFMVKEGRFRADLFHRLAVLRLRIPPLRRRLEDIPCLVDQIAPRLSNATGIRVPALPPETVAALLAHSWPGNIRELETVLARAAVRTGGGPVHPEDLEFDSIRMEGGPARLPAGWREPLEGCLIRETIRDCRNNLTLAAARIGWTRQKLYRRMSHLEIDRDDL